MYWWCGVDTELRIGKLSSLLPLINSSVSARREDQGRLIWAVLTRHIRGKVLHVVTSNLMLGAVTAASLLACCLEAKWRRHTIEAKSHHNVYAFVYMSCNLCEISCDSADWAQLPVQSL